MDISAILLWLKFSILCMIKGKWAASYQDTLQTIATSRVCILNVKSASIRVSSTTKTTALGRRRAGKGRFHIQNVKPCWRMIEGPVSVEEQKEPFLGLRWSSTTPCWSIWPTQKRLQMLRIEYSGDILTYLVICFSLKREFHASLTI